MPEPTTPTAPTVYQLRVVLREISPIIWRRLLIPADTTLAGLHDVLQVAFGWSGEHLHRFVVHGADYDAHDFRKLRLVDLGLRETERFVYHYGFGALCRHNLRVEQILPVVPLQGRQRHDIFSAASLLADMLGHPDARLGDYRDRLEELRPWLHLDRFDRRAA